jgi:hypothetical protein
MSTNLNSTVINTVIIISIIVVIMLIIYNYIEPRNKLHLPILKLGMQKSECNCNNDKKELSAPIVLIKNETMTNTSTKPILTLYYTDWCGYSKMFMAEWDKIKNSELSNIVNFEQYECDKNSQKCKENNIHGYPSLILHKNDGSKLQFPDNKQRNLDGITSFVKSNI